MKKPPLTKPPPSASEEMLAEYKFDYSKARLNRFTGQINKERTAVIALPKNAKRKTSRKS